MEKRSFMQFVEQELGTLPKFFIYMLLEWVMIILLFIDGFIAFLANKFARFFDLPIPCVLCSRIDHVLCRRSNDFYYNDSICNNHKKNVSCLAFCHAHKKLSDIRNLCENCLLSFATEKESDCDTYKSLLGILHKDIDQLLIDEDNEVQLSLPGGAKVDEVVVFEKSNEHRCSCCGQPMKVKSGGSKGKKSPSPRASANRNLDNLSHVNLKHKPDEAEDQEDNDRSRGLNLEKPLKEDGKGAPMPPVPEGDEEDRTPSFMKGNKFFGIPLSDSANSPRLAARTPRKLILQKSELGSEYNGAGDLQVPNSPRMDRKSLMSLYMELDEERSASAVAAYEAMAMITRLQTEKAAVQMEALQYQRMMEEQAEYDQEALEEMINLVSKREEEISELEFELVAYRQKYGRLKEGDYVMQVPVQVIENDTDGIQKILNKLPSFSSSSNARPESGITGENSETTTATTTNHQDQSTSPESTKNGSDSNPPVEMASVEAAINNKKAKRQMDRLKILEKKNHITTMGRFQRNNSEIDDDDGEEDEFS